MKNVTLLVVSTILICFACIVLFTLPALSDSFILNNRAAEIGTAIGGITAPVIGILTSVLLYITLIKQIEASADQRLKNEYDMVFLFYNQLSSDIDNFRNAKTENKIEKVVFGSHGILEFAKDAEVFKYTRDLPISEFFGTPQLLMIIKSFELIERRIESAKLSEQSKDLLRLKLQHLYEFKLKDALEMLCAVFDRYGNKRDKASDLITKFTKEQSAKKIAI